jgi:hypothetical protein
VLGGAASAATAAAARAAIALAPNAGVKPMVHVIAAYAPGS